MAKFAFFLTYHIYFRNQPKVILSKSPPSTCKFARSRFYVLSAPSHAVGPGRWSRKHCDHWWFTATTRNLYSHWTYRENLMEIKSPEATELAITKFKSGLKYLRSFKSTALILLRVRAAFYHMRRYVPPLHLNTKCKGKGYNYGPL